MFGRRCLSHTLALPEVGLAVSMRWMSSTTQRGAQVLEMSLKSTNAQSSFESATMVSKPIKASSLYKCPETSASSGSFRRMNQRPSTVAQIGSMGLVNSNLMQVRAFKSSNGLLYNRRSDQLEPAKHIQERKADPEGDKDADEDEEDDKDDAKIGYLPFPAPFHTINIISVLFIANIIIYCLMKWGFSDEQREWMVEHFTCSHENWWKVYPIFTSTLYQENALQMGIDCWLLYQFGHTVMEFMGEGRMAMFWAMTALGGAFLHVGRQYFELHYGMDPLEVRGRCFGPNPFILGIVSVEGLILRHLNFIQSPPVPFLVMTAFVMVIDVWRLFTTKPEEHGASTGGALVAYLFWILPARFYGLDRLTAAV